MRNLKISTLGQSCFVDDDPEFLAFVKAIAGHFARHEVVTFEKPSEALERLVADNRKLLERERQLNAIFVDENETRRLRQAIEWLFDESRHRVVETVFCDDQMPEMDCAAIMAGIKPSRMRRIMLTGGTEIERAIHAFNDGMIDTYLSKKTQDLPKILALLAERGPHVAMDFLWRDLDPVVKETLFDKRVHEAIEAIFQRHRVIEHVLIPRPAGFLCRTEDERCLWVQIETHETQLGAVEILRESGWAKADLEDLISGKKAACLEVLPCLTKALEFGHYEVSDLHVVHADPWLAVSVFTVPRP